jgi:hypothetical protein
MIRTGKDINQYYVKCDYNATSTAYNADELYKIEKYVKIVESVQGERSVFPLIKTLLLLKQLYVFY